MTPEERARALFNSFVEHGTFDDREFCEWGIAMAIRNAVNAKLEEVARELEALERGELASPYGAAELIRAMKESGE